MAPIVHAITPALAHVTCHANLLVDNVRALAEEHTYRSVFAIDGTHPYLYENPAIANHVSGTTFIDMGRQLLKAISHLYYDAPLDCRYVLHNIDIEFLRWAKLGVDIEVTVAVDAVAARRTDAPRGYGANLTWRQEGHLCARARSRFTTFSAALEAKLMTRQYGQPPANEVLHGDAPELREGPVASPLFPERAPAPPL
ncbi:MAG: AfsA-related hotdog domain-containing protein [Minicystis sp.]